MSVAQNDVLRITAEMSIGVDSIQNVYHFQYTGVAAVDDAVALLDAGIIMETLYSIINAKLSTTFTYDQVRVQNITQDVLLGATGWPVLVAGTDIDAVLPRPVAALITYPTAVPRTRGGTYYGGFTEAANVTGGAISAGLTTDLIAVAVRALTEQNIAGRTYEFVLVNRLLGTVIPYTSGTVHAVWRTQRRRRQGVGS